MRSFEIYFALCVFSCLTEVGRLQGEVLNSEDLGIIPIESVNGTPKPRTVQNIETHSTNGKQNHDYSFILPYSWQTFCVVHYKLVSGSNFTSRYAFDIQCQLKQGDKWTLTDYRTWASNVERNFNRFIPTSWNISVSVRLHCLDRSAVVSLPLPVKAGYLWHVSVYNCTVTDQLLEYNIQHDNIPDTLAVLEITDSIITVNSEQFFMKARNYQSTSQDFYCGSDVLEKFVLRNNTRIFTEMEQTLSYPNINLSPTLDKEHGSPMTDETSNSNLPMNEAEMNGIFVKLAQDHLKALYRCNHNKLRYLEESYQSSVSRHYSHFMLENAWYPTLEYFNMSHSGIVTMGPHMLDWRRYFPKMKYMDLSYNHIKYFTALTDNGLTNDTEGILDLRHNNITTLSSSDLEALALHNNTVFVDIRGNPIYCDCKLSDFVHKLQNGSVKLKGKYNYLKDITCVGPPKYAGVRLQSLHPKFCEALKFIVLSTPLVAVSTTSVVMLALFVVLIRYRKEIMILAFTRLHISLPCRKVYKSNDKKYDAFIAYSDQDSQWVFHTLLPRLESNYDSSGPGLKLCIHHRDFPIGGYISDNILDKIKDSRHTVLILSNNFLRSHWCKYEFKAAFTQSITEKKQHLIMVLLEDLDKSLIDKTLQQCLKTFTYVKSDDKLFWDKIIYALSDRYERVVHPTIYSCNSIPSMSHVSSVRSPNGRLTYSNTIQSFLNGYTDRNSITKPPSNHALSSKYALSVINEDNTDQQETQNTTRLSEDSVINIKAETTPVTKQSTEIYERQNSSNNKKENQDVIYQNIPKLSETDKFSEAIDSELVNKTDIREDPKDTFAGSYDTSKDALADISDTPKDRFEESCDNPKDIFENSSNKHKDILADSNDRPKDNLAASSEYSKDSFVDIRDQKVYKSNRFQDNSLFKALSPWFKSWFSVSMETELNNIVRTGSSPYLHRETSFHPEKSKSF